ncbi:RNA-directed DNA polymerase, eukaryota [Tanacetum coccineum]
MSYFITMREEEKNSLTRISGIGTRDRHLILWGACTPIHRGREYPLVYPEKAIILILQRVEGLCVALQGVLPSAITLERYLSDHRPILLREAANDYGPVPFRFFHHWLELDGFSKFVVDTWNIAPVDVSNRMRNMIRMLDVLIDKGDRTDAVVTKRMEVINSMLQLDHLHALDMAQKAKIKWAVEGDENTRFFHGILNKKRNQQNIRGVMVDGVWNDKPQNVKNEFLIHFQKRFEKPLDGRATVEMSYPRSLSIEQQEGLECEVTLQELKTAVWDCGMDKSPGPDGFTFGFYRHFWSTIEEDVFGAVKHFFTHGDIPKGCNSSFVALIPKVPDANLVNDFRPISLIGSIYKVIAKILANRLVGVLGIIVNEVQSAFITGRHILDGPLILNEVMQWCKSKKKQLFFKVDFEKAYDLVRWDFLDDVLKKFGFGNKWCKWIHECLWSSRGSILVNGNPTEEFQFFKGLK